MLFRSYSKQVGRPLYCVYSAIAFLNELGEIKATAIFDSYNGANINIHIYGPACITRGNYRKVLDYVFNELKCTRMTAQIPRSNRKLLKTIPRLNFVFETVQKFYFGTNKEDDAITYRITPKEASKWIKIDENTKTASNSRF